MSYDVKESKHTYCNPLPIPDIPRGKDEWYQFEHSWFSHENKPECVKGPDYRSISDPTVFYHDNKWYIYPSYGMAWVTSDFEHFVHKRTEPYCSKYSPCIIEHGGKFLMTSWCSGLYESDSPLGPFKELGDFIGLDGKEFTPCDPCIFKDDDGRIYVYAFTAEPNPSYDSGFNCVTCAYELDPNNPRQVIDGPIEVFRMNPKENPWERHGKHNQEISFGWVEGPHVLKYRGRYYMIYAAPDTCDSSYCMAVYYSDESPVKGFKIQKRNPLTVHHHGIVAGAGHGCVEVGPNDTLYAFYTISAPFLHRYERRIGMDLVAVDENRELYCPYGVTDTPQYIPGYIDDPVNNKNDIGYYNLTDAIRPIASSYALGREPLFATDESNLSFWQPKEDDQDAWIELDLSHRFRVGAMRVWWREVNLNYKEGITPRPVRYILEGLDKGNWITLLDRSDNDQDLNIDYQSFDVKEVNKVRLRILDNSRERLKVGVIDFSVFGKDLTE